MKKLIKILIILAIIAIPKVVEASTANISVTNNRSSAIVGNTIRTTVTVSSSANLGGWEFDLKYDTSRLRLTSSTFDDGSYVIDTATSSTQKSKTYTFNFVATASGRARIYVANSQVYDFNENQLAVTNGSRTVNIMTQAQYEASLSSNNHLKSLEVEDNELEPEFNKETLEYEVILEPETSKINVKGVLDDNSASVDGLGEHDVYTGDNEIEIVVTAQNGNQRTYIINAIVEELDPIILTINDEDYTVIRQVENINCPSLFELENDMLDDEEIPICYNEKIDLKLIATRNDEGDTVFFILNDEYQLYQEIVMKAFVFNNMNFPSDFEAPDNYTKVKLMINGTEVEAYRSNDNSELYLIYGMNVTTGEINIYQYDSEEEKIQRYFPEKEPEEVSNRPLIIVIVLAFTFFVSTLILLFQLKKIKDLFNETEKKIKKDLPK